MMPRWFRSIVLTISLTFILTSYIQAIAVDATVTLLPIIHTTSSTTQKLTPTPSPEPLLEYTFNPNVLSEGAIEYLVKDISQYQQLVDTVLIGEQNITFKSNKAMRKCISCFFAEFPLSALVSGDYQEDTNKHTLTLTYWYDLHEHIARVKGFTNRVSQVILSCIKPWYNDLESAIALYRYTAQNIVYQDAHDVSPYNALMNGVCICQSYDGVYSFLLRQIGIRCLSGGSFITNDTAHVWTIIYLDGSWFHMDTTFESYDNAGEGLNYFGMDDSRRLATGSLDPISVGINDWWGPAPVCDYLSLNVLNGVIRWEQDEDLHRIALYYNENEHPVYFDTQTWLLIDK